MEWLGSGYGCYRVGLDDGEWLKYFYRGAMNRGRCIIRHEDLIGKTIDIVDINMNNSHIFMGFSDGTYAFQRYGDTNMIQSTAENYHPNMGWMYEFVPMFDLVFNTNCYSDGTTEVSLTKVGEWFRDKTDIDMDSLYEKVKKCAAESSEINRKYQLQREFDSYKSLREKLGFTDTEEDYQNIKEKLGL